MFGSRKGVAGKRLEGNALYLTTPNWRLSLSWWDGRDWSRFDLSPLIKLDELRTRLQLGGVQVTQLNFKEGAFYFDTAKKTGLVRKEAAQILKVLRQYYPQFGHLPIKWDWSMRIYD